jgi:hypothetical protein
LQLFVSSLAMFLAEFICLGWFLVSHFRDSILLETYWVILQQINLQEDDFLLFQSSFLSLQQTSWTK